MKANFLHTQLKKGLFFTLMLASGFTFNQANAQNFFSDNFNRATLSPGGTPSLAYTTITTGGGSAALSSNVLLFTNGNPAGRSYVTGPLSSYSGFFNPTLNLNTDTITWSFNTRTSKTSTSDGFNNGKYGLAIVLAATDENLLGATTQGYAVVYGGTNKKTYRLVRFSGGLNADANLTDIINSGNNDFVGNENYVSIRVTYNPATNAWALYLRDDGILNWAYPASGVNNLLGTAVNNTYTSTLMSAFGFFWNYGTTTGITAQYDNFSVGSGPEGGPLPVSLTRISANRTSNGAVAINWDVENEVNITGYSVERSADGRSFTGILATVATNSRTYTQQDLSPLAADNFYRVKATSIGGQVQYSAIVKLAPSKAAASINVYPNPVANKTVQLQVNNPVSATWRISLHYPNGSRKALNTLEISAGTSATTIALPGNIAPGIYQLSFTDEANQVQVKTITVL